MKENCPDNRTFWNRPLSYERKGESTGMSGICGQLTSVKYFIGGGEATVIRAISPGEFETKNVG
jgi:hypothetical protein